MNKRSLSKRPIPKSTRLDQILSDRVQTVAHSHLPEGGARVTDAAGTLPHR